jgi:hypothetical protein
MMGAKVAPSPLNKRLTQSVKVPTLQGGPGGQGILIPTHPCVDTPP